MYNKGEVWFVEFPLEEDNSKTTLSLAQQAVLNAQQSQH